MKALFCYDGPLRKDQYGNYYGVALNSKMFSRYYRIANELEVVIRVEQLNKGNNTHKLCLLDLNRFHVTECPNLNNLNDFLFKRKQVKKILYERIRETDFVIVRLPSQIGNIAVDIARKMKKPYLVELVGCPWDSLWHHSFKGKLLAPYSYISTKKRTRNANHTIYVTKEFLQNKYPTLGLNINCSNVILEEFDDNILEYRLKKINGMLNTNKLILGTTGAVNIHYKGQKTVIEALGKLKKQNGLQLEYQLVGNGDQSYLKKVAQKNGVSENVKFLGSLPHDQVFKWLENIDIYIQPSKTEGLPRSLVEAMSRGLPSIGSNVGGIPELLESDCLFNNGRTNVKELCSMIESLNKEKMLKQAQLNFTKAKEYDKSLIENRRNKLFDLFAKTLDQYRLQNKT